MIATVTQILEPMSQRTSKAGKQYKAMKLAIEVENGDTATPFSFVEHAVADVVQVEKKSNDYGDFYNIIEPKTATQNQPSASANDLEPIFRAMMATQKKTNDLLEGINDLLVEIKDNTSKSGLEKARDVAKSLKKDAVREPTDLEIESGVKLDDIPFD